MDSKKKKHIARPMDAYRRKKELKCVDNPETQFRCAAAKKESGYRSTDAIIGEFDRIDFIGINSKEETFQERI